MIVVIDKNKVVFNRRSIDDIFLPDNTKGTKPVLSALTTIHKKFTMRILLVKAGPLILSGRSMIFCNMVAYLS